MTTDIHHSTDETSASDAAADLPFTQDEINRALAVARSYIEAPRAPCYLTIKQLNANRNTFTTVRQVEDRIRENTEEGRIIISHLLRVEGVLGNAKE